MGDMKVLDYDILVQELFPPIGGMLQYNAVISFLVVETKEGNKLMYPDLGKTYAKTLEEAWKKMQVKLDDWLSANEIAP